MEDLVVHFFVFTVLGIGFLLAPLVLGRWLEIDPNNETFTGDTSTDAAQLRKRHRYRQPYRLPETLA